MSVTIRTLCLVHRHVYISLSQLQIFTCQKLLFIISARTSAFQVAPSSRERALTLRLLAFCRPGVLCCLTLQHVVYSRTYVSWNMETLRRKKFPLPASKSDSE